MPVSLDDMLKDVPADRRAAIERHAEAIVLDNRRRPAKPGVDPDVAPSGSAAAMARSARDERVPDREDR